ncbi:MAG: ribonuclease R [Bacilli bacterium]
MEKNIIELLNKNNALSKEEISTYLKVDLETTEGLLEKLTNNLEITKTQNNKFTKFNTNKYVKGTLQITKKGYGFVKTNEEKDILVETKNLNGAINGDVVAVTILNKEQNTGKIALIKERENKQKVGEIVNKQGKCYVVLDDKKFIYQVIISNANLVDGMKVSVKLDKMINENTYSASLISILGHKDDPNIDLLSVTTEYGIYKDFNKDVIREVNQIKPFVTKEEIEEILKKGGLDLREEKIFTIDGDDTKDIDDAISVKVLPNNNFQVGVHIANVSHYVKPGTALFKEATLRGTSVYIPGSSIPMLPRELSNGICSLNPNEERLALSFIMEIDNEGNVLSFDAKESIIKSKIQMTYKNVNKVIENNEIPENYENYIEELKLLNYISKLLRLKRKQAGSIDFDMQENKIEVNELGKPTNISLRYRGEAEKLIEDFMVETGANASIFLDKFKKESKEISHVYRSHDLPNQRRLRKFKNFLTSLGYKNLSSLIDDKDPKKIATLINAIKTKENNTILERELLKCMAKAVYSTENKGHFALALPSYCQTTSPIRRSGDLLNHILIKDNIYNNQVVTINKEKDLTTLAEYASNSERNAASCEKEANKMKTAEYMEKNIGLEYEGIITETNSYGFYVELDNLVEGFVSIRSLSDDNYTYNSQNCKLIGETTKRSFSLGDKVTIIVLNACKKDRTIDFVIKGLEQREPKKIKKKKKSKK